MRIKFWGCRGSLPNSYNSTQAKRKATEITKRAVSSKVTDSTVDSFIEDLPFHLKGSYGTNTCCVEILGGTEVIICDAGSGIRDLGTQLIQKGPNMPKVYHIIMSHLHWDHIQGFPFFIPAYLQGITINIYGCHTDIKETFVRQQNGPTFPVALSDMGSTVNFHLWDKSKKYHIGGIDIDIIEQPHPGVSYGYKFSKEGKTIIYSTDAEHTDKSESDDYPFLHFIKDADILVFDGQFKLSDHLYTKQNWGHSSNLVGIELSIRAGVKELVLFHSDHNFDDFKLSEFLDQSLRYQEIFDDKSDLSISIAYDGLTMEA